VCKRLDIAVASESLRFRDIYALRHVYALNSSENNTESPLIHLAITLQSLHKCFETTAQLLRNRSSNPSQSPCTRCANALKSVRKRLGIAVASELLQFQYIYALRYIYALKTLWKKNRNRRSYTSQTPCTRCIDALKPLRNCFGIAAQTPRNHLALAAQTLRNHRANDSESQLKHLAITLQSLRKCFETTAISLLKPFPITVHSLHRCFETTAQ
jgi:hypothetical protein